VGAVRPVYNDDSVSSLRVLPREGAERMILTEAPFTLNARGVATRRTLTRVEGTTFEHLAIICILLDAVGVNGA